MDLFGLKGITLVPGGVLNTNLGHLKFVSSIMD